MSAAYTEISSTEHSKFSAAIWDNIVSHPVPHICGADGQCIAASIVKTHRGGAHIHTRNS